MPERIQRKRIKGWKMPPNTVSVTRPGEWGNPFVVGGWYKLGNGQPVYSFGYDALTNHWQRKQVTPKWKR